MFDPSRYLFLAGAAPFILLGAAHAWHTPVHSDERKGLSPRDPSVADAMRGTTPRLTDRTDLWRAWVGFNYSHSLGIKYWFRTPIIGIGVSVTCFALAWVLSDTGVGDPAHATPDKGARYFTAGTEKLAGFLVELAAVDPTQLYE